MFRFQVQRPAPSGVGSQSVLGKVHGRRIEKADEGPYAPFLGHAQEVALSGLLRPVVRAVWPEEASRAHPMRADAAFASLVVTACPDVETPYRKPDAEGLPLAVILGAEQPIGRLQPHTVGPQSDVLHAPGVRCPETVYRLQGGAGVYFEMGSAFLRLCGN